MSTRMSHPLHGFMDVYIEAEAVENEKNGWVRVLPKKVEDAPSVDTDVDVEIPKFIEEDAGLADDLRTRYIAKFGKPPHHRMLPETIADALKE